ncbi:MAG: amino acid permease [Acidobacteria bacterium]|nr:amino acid permease [Acidobacteriota bacterium]
MVESRLLPQPATRPTLVRSMGLPHASAMVVGTIIGATIFVQPSEISRLVPSLSGMLLVWLLSGLLTFAGATVCAELASAFPQTGGVYVFLKESYSPAMGFLWGWAMFWSMHSGIIGAVAVIFARYVGFFASLGDYGVKAVAIAAILVLSAINYIGVKQGSTLQALLTAAKVLAIGLLFVLFFALGSSAHARLVAEAAPVKADLTLRALSLAVTAGLFTFGGWHIVTYAAEETRNPEVTIPRALMLCILVVTVCYIGLNTAYLYVLPLQQVIRSTRIAADAANMLVGSKGAAVISGLVIVSAFGMLSGTILAAPRVYYAMAQDGLAFRWMGAIHPRFKTPHFAILLQAIWSSVLVATGTYRDLFTRVIYTEWIFFALMTIGVFRLRRRAGYAPSTRAWGYPVLPLLFVASTFVIVFNQIAANPVGCAAGLLLVVAGLPVYYFWARKGAEKGAVTHAYH